MGKPLRFALIAGEASGDQLGAGLIAEIKKRHPDAEFVGIGGDLMRQAGLTAWHDSQELAVMGLAEVLKHLPRLLRLRHAIFERILDWQPDVFIGIDAPDFNLGLEKKLKRKGIKTVHYVSPSIWAWRESRAKKIADSADRVLCLFPMEPPIYARYGVAADFVGHPIADRFEIEPDQSAARKLLKLPQDRKILAVLPGSRRSEIQRLLPVFLDALSLLQQNHPDMAFVIPAANKSCLDVIESLLKNRSIGNLQVIDGQSHQAMIASDAILLASGTAALEALLAKRPMVVAYRISALTYFIVKAFGMMKIDYYSLPNVLANEAVVPELMQSNCTAENIAAALKPMVDSPQDYRSLTQKFIGIHQDLKRDANHLAANVVLELAQEQ
ncbi:MAG TPA: lipid-A-disaccharide synthase [Arenimonas sp.]|nr:lipid-A-disaccharide synthase [Arenimonas sp.]HPW31805.1 lipid-A-disaccharide synthase [Arenimonas sp.]